MKSIIVMLVLLCSVPAKADDLINWVPLWENDKILLLSQHDIFFKYEYPNVIIPARGIIKAYNRPQNLILKLLCDEWKMSLGPNEIDQPAIIEISKGTVAAALFLKYCSELHRRTL